MSYPVTNKFIRTLALLNALKTFIAALKWDDNATTLFENVQIYPTTDLMQAIDDTRAFDSRLCFIVPVSDHYETIQEGREFSIKCERDFILLVSDQDFAQTQPALIGDGTTAVLGIVNIKDCLEEQLTGQNLGFDPRLIRLRPAEGEPMKVIKAGDARGRQVWSFNWRADAGQRRFSIP